MTGAIITGIRSSDSTRVRPRRSRLSSRASPMPIAVCSPTPTATSTPVFAIALQKRGSWASTRTKFWRPMNRGGKPVVSSQDSTVSRSVNSSGKSVIAASTTAAGRTIRTGVRRDRRTVSIRGRARATSRPSLTTIGSPGWTARRGGTPPLLLAGRLRLFDQARDLVAVQGLAPQLDLLLTAEPVGDRVPFLRHLVLGGGGHRHHPAHRHHRAVHTPPADGQPRDPAVIQFADHFGLRGVRALLRDVGPLHHHGDVAVQQRIPQLVVAVAAHIR